MAFMARNVQSALRMGEGRGVVLACAAAVGAEVVQLAPAVAKKALVGHGAADKTQVARMVARVLGVAEIDLPLDATDALALALAHLQRRRMDVLSATARRVAAAPGNTIRTGPRGRT
jgi:crossover junction endodeoxyribonuclease RuvC